MNLHRFALLFVLLTGAATAQAQLGAYGMIVAGRATDVPYPTSSGFSNTGSVNPTGGLLGVYYSFYSLGPVRLSADLRGSLQYSSKGADPSAVGSGTHLNTVLGGLQGSFKPVFHVSPYVQISAGLGRSGFGYNTGNKQNGVLFEGLVGADLKITPLLDWRVIELGMGSLRTNPTGTGDNNLLVKQVGTGLVLHFPHGN